MLHQVGIHGHVFSRDWPVVHGIPQWLLAETYILVKAKAHQNAHAVVDT